MTTPRELQQRYLQLPAAKRLPLLCWLVFFLSELGRASYVEAGNTASACVAELRAFNEAMQVLSKQLLALSGTAQRELGYPDEVVITIVLEAFRLAIDDSVPTHFADSCERAFRAVEAN